MSDAEKQPSKTYLNEDTLAPGQKENTSNMLRYSKQPAGTMQSVRSPPAVFAEMERSNLNL